jgi:hypothetical protein
MTDNYLEETWMSSERTRLGVHQVSVERQSRVHCEKRACSHVQYNPMSDKWLRTLHRKPDKSNTF